MVEVVPAFVTVTVYYDSFKLYRHYAGRDGMDANIPHDIAVRIVSAKIRELEACAASVASIVDIPVCYGGEFGPDLDEVASRNGLTTEEVIRIHASADYLVYMIGFAPGFPYLGGMDKRIATPRRSAVRTSVPRGTVGIAGEQTGVYPLDTPGGWQLIGRTPLPLFLPDRMPPTLVQAGDIVRFHPITRAEFDRMEGRR